MAVGDFWEEVGLTIDSKFFVNSSNEIYIQLSPEQCKEYKCGETVEMDREYTVIGVGYVEFEHTKTLEHRYFHVTIWNEDECWWRK